MPNPLPDPESRALRGAFDAADAALRMMEGVIAAGAGLPLRDAVRDATAVVRDLIAACAAAEGKAPAANPDLLEAFKVLVKGDPTWTAIRDNCRELVYYANCIELGREDALPAAPEKMAVRTARHIYLYARTRCLRDGRLAEATPEA